MKIAIVCDWLVGGGAELVVLQLHKMFPEAPIYTSYCTDEWRQKMDSKVVTGYLQHWPFSKLRKYIPALRAHWFSHLKLNDFELVISSSGAEAKGIRVPDTVKHIAYIHAPTHYYWARYEQYLNSPGFGAFDWLARLGLKLLVGPMRKWDYKAAQRPDSLLANSTFTQSQIKKYYSRDSTVIYPPIDTEKFAQFSKPQNGRKGFVITGRQTPYKRIDLAVAACTDLNVPLTVVGSGPEHQKLKKMAGPTIRFLGNLSSREDVAREVGQAQAFLFPGIDDFGIAPVEALAAGTPVIAYKAGGAMDYVVEGKTGDFFEEPSSESLKKVLQQFDATKFSQTDIQKHAQNFSIENFQGNIQKTFSIVQTNE